MSQERAIPLNLWSEGPETSPPQFLDHMKDALDNLYGSTTACGQS